jgi:hypothetical protein
VIAGLLLGIQQAVPVQSTSIVEGVVVDGNTSLPLVGVNVTLMPAASLPAGMTLSASQLKSGFTDDQGHFTIAEVSSGRYRAVPDKTGFVFASRPGLKAARDPGAWIQFSSGQTIPEIQISMVKQAVISGRVLDSKGQPSPGNTASVALMRYTYDDTGNRALSWVPGIKYPNAAGSFVRMDDMGRYRFYGLPAGDYYLEVSGGPRGGTPPKLPLVSFYPGTVEESRAVMVHVDAGDEIDLGTMTFQQVDATLVRLRFKDLEGSPPATRTIALGYSFITTTSAQPMTIPVKPGHYDALVTTPTSYGHVIFDAGSSDVDQEVVMMRGFRVKILFSLEDEAGKRAAYTPVFTEFSCGLRSGSTHSVSLCSSVPRDGGLYVGPVSFGSGDPPTIPPDTYTLEFSRMPEGMFVRGATISGQDVLRTSIPVERDLEIEVVLSKSVVVLDGSVRDSKAENLPDAVVALVPDKPLRAAGDLYRSTVTDAKGNFELRGIAPGNYHLFAWRDLEGAAYRNQEFMKKFEEGGTAIQLEKGSNVSVDVTVLDGSMNTQN